MMRTLTRARTGTKANTMTTTGTMNGTKTTNKIVCIATTILNERPQLIR